MITRTDGVWFTMTIGLVMNEEEYLTNQFTMLITFCPVRIQMWRYIRLNKKLPESKLGRALNTADRRVSCTNKRRLRVTRNNQLWRQTGGWWYCTWTEAGWSQRVADGLWKSTGHFSCRRRIQGWTKGTKIPKTPDCLTRRRFGDGRAGRGTGAVGMKEEEILPRSSRSARSPRVLMTKHNGGKCPRKKPGRVADPSSWLQNSARYGSIPSEATTQSTGSMDPHQPPDAPSWPRMYASCFGPPAVHASEVRACALTVDAKEAHRQVPLHRSGWHLWVGKSYPVERRGVY